MIKFFLYKDAKQEWRWRLKGGNGETIADCAEGYKDKESARHGINLIRSGAKDAIILEDKE